MEPQFLGVSLAPAYQALALYLSLMLHSLIEDIIPVLLSDPTLSPIVLPLIHIHASQAVNCNSHPFRPPPRINPNHEFGIRLRHDSYVFFNQKGIIELTRRFRLSMLDIPYFTIDPYLHACIIFHPTGLPLVPTIIFALPLRPVRISNRSSQIQHAPHWHRVLKRARIKRNECRS